MHTPPFPHYPPHGGVYGALLRHASAPTTNTDLTLATAIRAQHPHEPVTIASAFECRLLAFAAAGHATVTLDTSVPSHVWAAPETVWFARYTYTWDDGEWTVYIATWQEGYSVVSTQYVVGAGGERVVAAAVEWEGVADREVWVFDAGMWRKERGLWEEVAKARWEDVVLEEEMKRRIVEDVEGFFKGREVYRKYSVPWKRGIIFHGPPGNGKTISIKALMNTLGQTVPLLYVKTLHSFWGEEASVGNIFQKARDVAPCLLVFEDLDSLVSDNVRSYFLNEVDGLARNDGVCMLGSTNHLERLDPGISKRPSRFDRKYLFPLPATPQRVQYCNYWRHKLADNAAIEFPEKLSVAIAEITAGFSFAYLKEAFVASLLVIAGGGCEKEEEEEEEEEELKEHGVEKLLLWRVIKEQIKNLREEMDGGEDENRRQMERELEVRVRGGAPAGGVPAAGAPAAGLPAGLLAAGLFPAGLRPGWAGN